MPLAAERTVLVDAVSYEGNTAAPYTEGSETVDRRPSARDEFLSRCPDGNDTDINNADLRFRVIAGQQSTCPPPPLRLRIREIQGRAHPFARGRTGGGAGAGVSRLSRQTASGCRTPTRTVTRQPLKASSSLPAAPPIVVGEAVQVNGTVTNSALVA